MGEQNPNIGSLDTQIVKSRSDNRVRVQNSPRPTEADSFFSFSSDSSGLS